MVDHRKPPSTQFTPWSAGGPGLAAGRPWWGEWRPELSCWAFLEQCLALSLVMLDHLSQSISHVRATPALFRALSTSQLSRWFFLLLQMQKHRNFFNVLETQLWALCLTAHFQP